MMTTPDAARGPLQYPPVWLALFAAMAWAAGQLWPHGSPFVRVMGWALIAAGILLMGVAALTMARARATLMPTSRPTALVTHGVYAFSRNPIYLADAIILAGLCLIWAPLALPVLVPGFMIAITRRFITREERWLRERDAATFSAWAARTRRWL